MDNEIEDESEDDPLGLRMSPGYYDGWTYKRFDTLEELRAWQKKNWDRSVRDMSLIGLWLAITLAAIFVCWFLGIGT